MRHAFKSHGDVEREKARGQIAIRKHDFRAIPLIVRAATDISVKGEPRSTKPRRLVYTARIADRSFEYVETINPARRTLAFKTMRKW